MSDNNYDVLGDQIGGAGSAEQPKGLGRIQHKEILGQKADLSAEDQASMEAFQAGVHRDRSARMEAAQKADFMSGWVAVDRGEMGIRSEFYPPNWKFYVKPATVQAIKNWTAVDETNAAQVNDVMNEIIRSSVRIETGEVLGAGWAQINSWDRFWFVLKVREATFVQGETKIEFEDACSECDSDIMYTLTSAGLFYEFPDADLIEKYWDGKVWKIDPTEYGVDHAPITLYTPKLGKDQKIIEWARAKVQADQKIDENFIKYLVWMLPQAPRDVDAMDRTATKLQREYKNWSVEMAEFMDDVVRNITINPQETLRCKCPHCGQEATSKVRFPNGIKQLFRTETGVKKFGSR